MSEDNSSFEISLGSIEEEKGVENDVPVANVKAENEPDANVKEIVANMIANVDNMLEAQEEENDAKAVAAIEAARRDDLMTKNVDIENKLKEESSKHEEKQTDADIEISVFDDIAARYHSLYL